MGTQSQLAHNPRNTLCWRTEGIMKAQLLLLALSVACIHAQQFSPGKCPNFQPVKNFDVAKYIGRWYEYSNHFEANQLYGDCVIADYIDASTPEQKKVGVTNRSINRFTGK